MALPVRPQPGDADLVVGQGRRRVVHAHCGQRPRQVADHAPAPDGFHQQVDGAPRAKWRFRPDVTAHQVETVLVEDFRCAQPVAQPADLRRELDRGRGGLDAHQGHRALGLARHEAKADGRDHPEGALAADQQLGPVVAGVVLQEAGEVAEDAAVGQHRFCAEDLVTHRPVTQHVDAACVGRRHPPDRGGVPRREIHGKREVGRARGSLHRGERGPRAGRELAAHLVHRSDPVEPGGAQYHWERPAAHGRGDRRPDEAGVPSLHDHGDAGAEADPEDARHLAGGAGPHHQCGGAREPPRPVRRVPGYDIRVDEHVRRAHHAPQPLREQGW